MATSIGTSGWSYDHWELGPCTGPVSCLSSLLARYACITRRSSSIAASTAGPGRRPSGLGSDDRLTASMSVMRPAAYPRPEPLRTREARAERIAARWHELGDKRAVLLVQLAPAQARDDARLAYFLQSLPDWVRVAVEFRHPSWHHEDIFALLESQGAAYCVMSGAHLPCILRTTRLFAYVRMHGPDHGHLYAYFVQLRRPVVVGRPDQGMGTGGPRCVRVLQQRR